MDRKLSILSISHKKQKLKTIQSIQQQVKWNNFIITLKVLPGQIHLRGCDIKRLHENVDMFLVPNYKHYKPQQQQYNNNNSNNEKKKK